METERGTGSAGGRFELPPGRTLSGVARMLRGAGYLPGSCATSRYECVFVDTQDGRLIKEGYRLSVRIVGRLPVWRLAGPDGDAEFPFEGARIFRSLAPDTPGIPPLARALAGNRLLLPLVRLRVFVQEISLEGPSAARFQLRAERFLAAPPRGTWPKGPWRHGLLLAGLLEGAPDAFLHLVTYLRDRLGLPTAPGDACRLALQGLDLPEPGAPVPPHLRIRRDEPLVEAAQKVVAQQVLKMRANRQGTLDDLDSEYLHDLRVATRRLRSALRLFADVLGPARCDTLRTELRWLGGILGTVRDVDVFRLNLHEQAQRLGDAGAIADRLAGELGRRREPARAALVAALTSRRLAALLRRLDALAAAPPPRRPRGAQRTPVAVAAPERIWNAQKRVLRVGRTVGPDTPAADLHRLRILFKRLRYACEFFRDAFADPVSGSDPLADYLRTMVRFQDCLGEHQDAVTAMARIQDLAREAVQHGTLAPEQLLDLGSLIQVQREIARDRRGRLARLWSRFDRRSVRRPLRTLRGSPEPHPSPTEAAVTPAG